ncbi:MAG: hypothetical protein QM775_31800 [Pirellulales bacterium]
MNLGGIFIVARNTAIVGLITAAAAVHGKDSAMPPPSVGIAREMRNLVLPGTELEAAPIVDRRAPLVLRSRSQRSTR